VVDSLSPVTTAAGAIATHIELALQSADATPAIRRFGPNVAASARAVTTRVDAMKQIAGQAFAATSVAAAAPLVLQLRATALTLDTEGLNPLEAAVYSILEAERLPRLLR
jgi:hypothetical protein